MPHIPRVYARTCFNDNYDYDYHCHCSAGNADFVVVVMLVVGIIYWQDSKSLEGLTMQTAGKKCALLHDKCGDVTVLFIVIVVKAGNMNRCAGSLCRAGQHG